MTLRLDNRDADFEDQFTALLNQKREASTDVNTVVREIIEKVRADGDDALIEYTSKFDRLNLSTGNDDGS